MISLQNISKSFNGRSVLSNISFDIEKGEIVGLLGPNGAGKTTTMRILTGILAPTSGTVAVNGQSVLTNPLGAKSSIGYMPENNPLYPDLKVREYLYYRGKLKGISRQRIRERFEFVVDKCLLQSVCNTLIGTLSKGFKQRVGLADAMIHDPAVLILDEPTVGLDPSQIRQVRQLITQIGSDKTVLLSTHILPEVEITCSKVIIINKGRIQAVTSTQELHEYSSGKQSLYLEIKENIKSFEKLLDETDIKWDCIIKPNTNSACYTVYCPAGKDYREDIFQLVLANKSILLEMRSQVASLEDVFIDIVTEDSFLEGESE